MIRKYSAPLVIASLAAYASLVYANNTDYQNGYTQGFQQGFQQGYQQGLKDGQNRSGTPTSQPYPSSSSSSSTSSSPTQINVTKASYGTYSTECDATSYIANQANGRPSASIKVTNGMCGDPDPGNRKWIDVTYQCGTKTKTATANEHKMVSLDCRN